MMRAKFRPVVKMIDPQKLVPGGFNPPQRVTEKSLALIMQGIVELGGVVQPIIVSRDLRIGDGHRRVAAAIKLGLTEVPIIELPLGLQEMWGILNNTQKAIVGRDWVEVHSLGFSLENAPVNVRKQITEIKNLIGEDGFSLLAEKGMTTTVLGFAKRLANYINTTGTKPDSSLVAQCLLWLINFGQQYAARKAIEDGMSPGVMRYAISNNESLGKVR